MANKILIAVVNCQSRKVWAQAVRETWKPLLEKAGADVIFFRGSPAQPPGEEDVIQLNCDDSYSGLPAKVKAIICWAFDNGYDYVLKCDDDVVLSPDILKSGFNRHKYSGRGNRPGKFIVPYGFNYWMSRECMQKLYNEPLPISGNDDEKWVAERLHSYGIDLVHSEGYHLYVGLLADRTKDNYGYRPLNRLRKNLSEDPELFSWAIYLTSHGDSRIPEEKKVQTFYTVFADKVGKKHEQGLVSQ